LKPWSSFPSLLPSARVPRILLAPPTTARATALSACRPSAAVSHLAGNPAHAAVPPAGPPRHHRRPGNYAGIRETRKTHKILFPSLLIFPRISPNFLNSFFLFFPFFSLFPISLFPSLPFSLFSFFLFLPFSFLPFLFPSFFSLFLSSFGQRPTPTAPGLTARPPRYATPAPLPYPNRPISARDETRPCPRRWGPPAELSPPHHHCRTAPPPRAASRRSAGHHRALPDGSYPTAFTPPRIPDATSPDESTAGYFPHRHCLAAEALRARIPAAQPPPRTNK
jgi:hypothetical protein